MTSPGMIEIELELDVTDIIEYPYPKDFDHNQLLSRDASDSHPIGAITGLQDELDSKMDDSQIDTEAISTASDKIPSSGLVKAAIDALDDSKVDKVAGSSLMTDAEHDKLNGIEAGAEVNVNADWTAESGDAQILNKPQLAEVATSGAYADLSGKPTLGTAAALDTGTSQGNIPILGANGKLADSVIPSLSIMEFKGTVSTKNDLTTLSTAQSGDYAIVNGTTKADNGMWILSGTYSTLSDWKQVVTSSDVISVNSKTGIVTLDKSDIGLGNVDNTADADKPVSTAVQTALNNKQDSLTFDDAPTASSNNPVKSGGVYTALSAKADDNAVVHLNTAETILSEKTVSVSTMVPLAVKRNSSTFDVSKKPSDRNNNSYALRFNGLDVNNEVAWSINTVLNKSLASYSSIECKHSANDGTLQTNRFLMSRDPTTGEWADTLDYQRAYNASNINDIVTIGSLQASTDVVHTAGNETIGGIKTYTSDVIIKNVGMGFRAMNTSLPSSRTNFANGVYDFNIGAYVNESGSQFVQLNIGDTTASRMAKIRMWSPSINGWAQIGVEDNGGRTYGITSYNQTPAQDNEILTAGNGVTLGTAQEISGLKTLNVPIEQQMYIQMGSSIGTAPSVNTIKSIRWIDSATTRMAQIHLSHQKMTNSKLLTFHSFYSSNMYATLSLVAENGASYATCSNRVYSASNTDDVVTIGSLQASTDVLHTAGNETAYGLKKLSTVLGAIPNKTRVLSTDCMDIAQFDLTDMQSGAGIYFSLVFTSRFEIGLAHVSVTLTDGQVATLNVGVIGVFKLSNVRYTKIGARVDSVNNKLIVSLNSATGNNNLGANVLNCNFDGTVVDVDYSVYGNTNAKTSLTGYMQET